VGKTTTICGLALTAAVRGLKTLAIDFDDQANLSISLAGDAPLQKPDQYELITKSELPPSAAILQVRPQLDLLPASPALRYLDRSVSQPFILREAFDRWTLSYDLVLIDTPGNIASPRLTMALCAASAYYIPVELRAYSMDSLPTVFEICANAAGRYYNPDLKNLGILASKVDQVHQSGSDRGLPVKPDQRALYQELRTSLGPERMLGLIGRRDPVDQAFSRGKLLQELPPSENTRRAAEEFEAFANLVFERSGLLGNNGAQKGEVA
jgi:cellulose biosynthesis protein BcsQ